MTEEQKSINIIGNCQRCGRPFEFESYGGIVVWINPEGTWHHEYNCDGKHPR